MSRRGWKIAAIGGINIKKTSGVYNYEFCIGFTGHPPLLKVGKQVYPEKRSIEQGLVEKKAVYILDRYSPDSNHIWVRKEGNMTTSKWPTKSWLLTPNPKL